MQDREAGSSNGDPRRNHKYIANEDDAENETKQPSFPHLVALSNEDADVKIVNDVWWAGMDRRW
jgi:hypothetical protein